MIFSIETQGRTEDALQYNNQSPVPGQKQPLSYMPGVVQYFYCLAFRMQSPGMYQHCAIFSLALSVYHRTVSSRLSRT